jgi:hypothetical protein
MSTKEEILPGWTMTIEKQKDDLYRLVATDKHGYKSEIFDSDIDQGSMRCLERAFEIEQKIGKNRNEFFFELLSGLTDTSNIKEKRYDKEIFGSWVIGTKEKRIVLDGRDYEIRIEKKNRKLFRNNWITIRQINHLENLKYLDILDLANIFLKKA